jgi:hypothetical protein
MTIEPVTTSTLAICAQHTAFELWTEGIDRWWPRERTIGGAAHVAEVVLEARPGGRLYERWHDGSEHDWGRVETVEAPGRLALAWCRHRDGGRTDVVIEFVPEGPVTTRVRITHTGWDRLTDGATERAGYQPGPGALWGQAFAGFGAAALDPGVHRFFATRANNATWQHLDPLDVAAALHHAHAAAYHWAAIGTAENEARAAWLVSHVYAVAGWAAPARFFADRCLAVTLEHGLVDFDLAYAHEGVARAAACAGDLDTARSHRDAAARVIIAEAEDREIFEGDLASEPWYGLSG